METQNPGSESAGQEKTPLEPSQLPPPLFAVTSSTTGQTGPVDLGWLRNPSFTADLAVINDAVSSLHQEDQSQAHSDEDTEDQRRGFYELVEEREGTSCSDSDKRKKRRKGKRARDEAGDGFSSRKSSVRVWKNLDSKPQKDYHFDAHGDRDNLVYGCLYRMDVPSYKPCNPTKVSGFGIRGLYRLNQMGSLFNGDGDLDGLDTQLKSGGRYWSANYVALERHKNLKRLRLRPPKQPAGATSHDFIPLSNTEMLGEDGDDGVISIVEESWEDEVFEKTREFNKLTRERPHDEKLWLEFAEFQDKVASTQPQKGARLQTLEKKISILEKAVELNPENEELLIYLMNSYRKKDSSSVLFDRWEKVLMQHSGSHRLWKEYLGVLKREFSKFKVSDVRKMYAHAVQALSTSSNKLCRQVYQTTQSSPDSTLAQLELGLVDTFLDLCKFEWQAGYRELATALLQAEIEYSLFCPPMMLSDRSKLRLFEHFWNSDGPRVGEEGAMGWSSWLEKEEENRQRIVNDKSSQDDDRGGWTGWSEPVTLPKESDDAPAIDEDALPEELLEENQVVNQEDDTATLLKQLGIAVDIGTDCEIKDTATWTRWSEEESSRDYEQWMPKHGSSDARETIDRNNEEPFLGAVLFEDVNEFLFSLNSREAQLSLLYQFIEFFGGEISKWASINSSKWSERLLNLDTLPDCMMHNLRRVNDMLAPLQSGLCCNFLEFLSGCEDDRSKQVEMMKFLRNAILQCLNVLPRTYALQEAALSAEELSVSKMDSSSAIRALAKSLLKADRQDVLFCGVYAKKEAESGNIDHARRVFDMALSSVDSLSPELRSKAPILRFWYAEAEFANSARNPEQSFSRVLHILSSLGSGLQYSPFECKPSSLQILRAQQGFKERLSSVRSSWLRGAVDDQSLAVICSAALFEELTTGWAACVKIFEEAFAMVLPERRIHSHHLEFLFNYYVRVLLRCQNELTRSKVWESILKGLEMYPSSSELFASLLEIGHIRTTTNKLRTMFDNYCHRNPSIVVGLYALLFEMSKGGSPHRIHGLFEKALANERLSNSVILWRIYIAYEISIASNPSAARRVFFRAIHACPWSKKLWLDGFLKLSSILTPKELSDLQEVMRDKELNLRTDIYEILLQDDLVS